MRNADRSRSGWGPWTLGALVLALLAGVAFQADLRESAARFWLVVSEDTRFAPTARERAFAKISVGDSEASVRSLLGAPGLVRRAEPYSVWLYAPDPCPSFIETGVVDSMADYSLTVIRFDEDGRFFDADGQFVRSHSRGASPPMRSWSTGAGCNLLTLGFDEIIALKQADARASDIVGRFGEPQAKFESRAVRWLDYSRPVPGLSPSQLIGSRNFGLLSVAIDESGRVSRTLTEIDED